MTGTEKATARGFIFDPETELILAVYRRARQDMLEGKGATRVRAELFLLAEGFDPGAVRLAWQREKATK